MGKGGDASAVASQKPTKLVGDNKAEKYTWAEVKKHVSPTATNGPFHAPAELQLIIPFSLFPLLP